MRTIALLVFGLGLLAASDTRAHGGGLNAEGCHNNRRTGDYHCHRATARSTPRQEFHLRDNRPDDAFGNCSEARAAGAAPVRRGEPGYGAHLDRDNDGVGCE